MSGLREPTAAELTQLEGLLRVRKQRGDRVLAWLKAHPDVRLDFPMNFYEPGKWTWANTPIGAILRDDILHATHPVVAEALTRVPDFGKQSNEAIPYTLEEYMKWYRGIYMRLYSRLKTPLIKAKYDLLRKTIADRTVKPIGEARMADSLARQKNLPPDVGDLIASKLSGQTGPTSSQIQTQRETAKKQLGVRGGRRTRRNTSRKQGARR
jgi:hypothetical protein